MKNANPTYCDTEFTLVMKGTAIRFKVKFTAWGEVLNVENEFSELPEKMREALVAYFSEGTAAYLEAYNQVFRFAVPLALMGYLKDEKWAVFSEALQKSTIQRPDWKEAIIHDTWVKEAWALHGSNTNQKQFRFMAGTILQAENNVVRWVRSDSSRWTPDAFSDEFLIGLLPLFQTKGNIYAIYYLSNQLNESQIQQLLSLLATEDHPKKAGIIIQKLAFFHSPAIRKRILAYYAAHYTHRPLSIHHYAQDQTLSDIIKSLRYYQDEEVRELVVELLQKRHIPIKAYQYLSIYFGISETEIVAQIRPLLAATASFDEWRLALSAYTQISDKSLLPSSDALIDIYIKFWKEDQTYNAKNFLYAKNLLAFRKDETTIPRLFQLVQHPQELIHQGAISEYIYVGDMQEILPLIGLLDSQDENRHQRILRTAMSLSSKGAKRELLTPFLEGLQKSEHPTVRRIFVVAIYTIIQKYQIKNEEVARILLAEYERQAIYDKMPSEQKKYRTSAQDYMIRTLSICTSENEQFIQLLEKRGREGSLSALRTLGRLSEYNYFKILEQFPGIQKTHIKRNILLGIQSHLKYNSILHQIIAVEKDVSLKALAMTKLSPDENDISFFQKHLLPTNDMQLRIAAFQVLISIPQFLCSPAFIAIFHEKEQQLADNFISYALNRCYQRPEVIENLQQFIKTLDTVPPLLQNMMKYKPTAKRLII